MQSLTVKTHDTFSTISLASVVFILNPFLGIIFLLTYLYLNTHNEKLYFCLYIFISLYVGLINTTKLPVSDLANYKDYFDSAGRLSFSEYLALFDHEIFFYAITYTLNIVLLGSFKLYIIFITFIQYYLCFISIHKFFKDDGKRITLFAVSILALNASSFSVSIHLLRQMTALSLFVYFFIEKLVNNKTKWWLLIFASLIHSSSLLLFLLSFLPFLKKKTSWKSILKLTAIVYLLFLFGALVVNYIGNLLVGISWLSYPFRAFDSMANQEGSWYDGSSVTSIRISYSYYIIIPAIIACLGTKKSPHYSSLLKYLFIYVLILESFVMANLTFMQMRMAFYIYLFSCFAIPLMVLKFKNKLNSNNLFTIQLIILLLFIFKFTKAYIFISAGGKNMASLTDILTYPVVMYF